MVVVKGKRVDWRMKEASQIVVRAFDSTEKTDQHVVGL